jgi:hypothetical protein
MCQLVFHYVNSQFKKLQAISCGTCASMQVQRPVAKGCAHDAQVTTLLINKYASRIAITGVCHAQTTSRWQRSREKGQEASGTRINILCIRPVNTMNSLTLKLESSKAC